MSDAQLPSIISVAEVLGLNPRSAGDGKANIACPASVHAHDEERPKCGLSDELGSFCCLKCGTSGGIIKLIELVRQCDEAGAKAWLRQHFPRQTSAPVPATGDPLGQLASIRGWRREALTALGCQTSRDGVEIGFPMRDAAGKVVGWRRRRTDGKPFTGGQKALTKKNCKNGILCPWPLPADGPVLLVEGEADAAAALSADWPAVIGTPGATPGKAVESSLCELLKGRQVVMAPDPDEPGAAWLDRIGRKLVAANADVRVVPADPEGRDLDKRLRAAADPAAELARLVQNAQRFTPAARTAKKQQDPTSRAVNGLQPGECSDLANAHRFQRQHGTRVLFDPAAGWRVYDDASGCWAAARAGEIERMTHATARSIFSEAAASSSSAVAEALARWAVKSMNSERLAAMARVAQALLAVDPERLDADPWLINCQNGIIDLRTGELLPHDRTRLITRCCAADYHPGTT